MKRIRQMVGYRIWDVANWIYPYTKHEPDTQNEYAWTMEATFIGTQEKADELFAKLTELDCGHSHPLHECSFAVGGMRREDLKAEDE